MCTRLTCIWLRGRHVFLWTSHQPDFRYCHNEQLREVLHANCRRRASVTVLTQLAAQNKQTPVHHAATHTTEKSILLFTFCTSKNEDAISPSDESKSTFKPSYTVSLSLSCTIRCWQGSRGWDAEGGARCTSSAPARRAVSAMKSAWVKDIQQVRNMACSKKVRGWGGGGGGFPTFIFDILTAL